MLFVLRSLNILEICTVQDMAPIVDRSNDASPTYIYFRNSEILVGKRAALVLVVHLGRGGGGGGTGCGAGES